MNPKLFLFTNLDGESMNVSPPSSVHGPRVGGFMVLLFKESQLGFVFVIEVGEAPAPAPPEARKNQPPPCGFVLEAGEEAEREVGGRGVRSCSQSWYIPVFEIRFQDENMQGKDGKTKPSMTIEITREENVPVSLPPSLSAS
jgi:hypothetical protein